MKQHPLKENYDAIRPDRHFQNIVNESQYNKTNITAGKDGFQIILVYRSYQSGWWEVARTKSDKFARVIAKAVAQGKPVDYVKQLIKNQPDNSDSSFLYPSNFKTFPDWNNNKK